MLANVRQGKGNDEGGRKPRRYSGISVQPSNPLEHVRNKKLILQTHPLKCEDPSTWNNIPVCVANAITNIVECLCENDESLFDYQITNNNRLHKLQEQIHAMKKTHLEKMVSLSTDLNMKLNDN